MGYGFYSCRSSSPRDSLHQRRERVVRPESPSPMVKAAGPKPHRDHYRARVEDENNFSARFCIISTLLVSILFMI